MQHLMHLLLNLFGFGLMMFAAAPVVAGGDTGGGDAGIGDGGGSSAEGDAGVSDQNTGTEDASGDLGQDDANRDDNALSDVDAGVNNNASPSAKWQEIFKAAKAQGLDKEVKQLYFANQRLVKAFPGGVNDAIKLSQTIEQFGGLEGIENVKAEYDGLVASNQLLETNPQQWIQQEFDANPEAALKTFSHSLEYVAEKHPDNYNHLMAKVIINDLNGELPVRDMYNFLAAMKDNPQATELAKKLADYYNSRRDLAKNVPEKRIDPQQKALDERAAKVDQKEMEIRYTQVNGEIAPQMKASVTRTLTAEAKALGLDVKKLATDYPGEFSAMLDKIHAQIKAAVIKDQRFIDNYYAVVKKGDLKRAAQLVNQKHDKVIPDVVRAVSKQFGLFKGKKTTPAGGGNRPGQDNGNPNANAAGFTRVNAKPENRLIDYSKTTHAMQLDGQYILRDGKKVQVVY